MKRWIAAVLSAILLLSLCACGSDGKAAKPKTLRVKTRETVVQWETTTVRDITYEPAVLNQDGLYEVRGTQTDSSGTSRICYYFLPDGTPLAIRSVFGDYVETILVQADRRKEDFELMPHFERMEGDRIWYDTGSYTDVVLNEEGLLISSKGYDAAGTLLKEDQLGVDGQLETMHMYQDGQSIFDVTLEYTEIPVP